jgi:hypothetical protein
MNLADFTETSKREYERYLTDVFALDILGRIDSKGGSILFPSLMLCSETKDHFIVELIGAHKAYDSLTVKNHKESSTVRYLGQFESEAPDPAIRLASDDSQFTRLTLSQGVWIETIRDRFPFAHLFPSVLIRAGGKGGVIDFADTFRSAAFHNCLLVNQYEAAVRVKHVLSMAIIAKGLSKLEYTNWLQQRVLHGDDIRGIHTVPNQAGEDFVLAGQFANLYLLPGLRETTLGEFLKTHPSILERAFGSRRFVYEASLEWREGPSLSEDQAINPDLLLERPDGFFDIYDLKTAALTKATITKGSRRRRRFIDYVEEGIAQLAHYRDYFTFPKNAEHAWEKYGVRVNDPNLTLVVGHFENANPVEIAEASRKLDRFTILDYDSMLQLFLSVDRATHGVGTKDS